jgi:hypothetical protein
VEGPGLVKHLPVSDPVPIPVDPRLHEVLKVLRMVVDDRGERFPRPGRDRRPVEVAAEGGENLYARLPAGLDHAVVRLPVEPALLRLDQDPGEGQPVPADPQFDELGHQPFPRMQKVMVARPTDVGPDEVQPYSLPVHLCHLSFM